MDTKLLLLMLSVIALGFAMPSLAQEGENIEHVANLLNRWEGGDDIAISGNYAYIPSRGTGLQIIDISDLARPIPVGCYSDTLGYMKTIDISGDYAYIGYSYYYAIFDISEPLSPDPITIHELDYNLNISMLYGDNLYLSGKTGSGDNIEYNVEIVDVSNPHEPEVISSWRTEEMIQDICVFENSIYVVTLFNSYLLQLNEDDSLEIVSEFSGGGKLVVEDGLIYLMDDYTLKIIDISNPGEIIGECEIDAGVHYLCVEDIIVEDNLVFVGSSSPECMGNRNPFCMLSVIDISDHTEPEFIGSLELALPLEEFIYLNGNIIVAQYGGIRVIDISEPQTPVTVGYYNVDGSPVWVHFNDDFMYVYSYHYANYGINSHTVWCFDCSEPDNPIAVEWMEFDSYGMDIFATPNNNLLTVSYDSVRHFDISQPPEMREIASYPNTFPNCWELFVEESFIYMSNSEGLVVLEMSDLDTLTLVGEFNTDGWSTSSIFVSEGIIYVTKLNSGLSILDASEPAQMSLIANYYINGDTKNIQVVDDLAFVSNSRNGLMIFDVSNPSAPEPISSIEINEIDKLHVEGDCVYVGTDTLLVMVDVSDIENPIQTGYYDLDLERRSEIKSIHSENDMICLALGNEVKILRNTLLEISDDIVPSHDFQLYSNYPNPFNSSTTINYALPQSQRVVIQTYDVSGRLIDTLYDNFQSTGNHSIVWDSRDFGSGIYFVQVQTETETKIAKLVAIK